MNRVLSATSNIAAAALAVCVLAGHATAAALCARPQDMTALRAAALQQELMVAALTCRAEADFNLFVISYREELLKTDRALKDFFLRQDARKGEDAYNAYKTQLANVSSLRSLHDPQFCRSAKVAFDVALNRKGALAELASERPTPVATGYEICSPDAPKPMMAEAAPSVPARRVALLDSPPPVPIPKLAPRPHRASPPILPQRVAMVVAEAAPIPAPTHRVVSESLPPVPVAEPAAPRERALAQASPPRDADDIDADDRQTDARFADDADNRQTDARFADDAGERDDFASDLTEARDDAEDDAPRYAPRYAEAQPARAYDRSGYGNVPDAYRPNAYWVDAGDAPPGPRLVRGRDGHWYLLLYSGR